MFGFTHPDKFEASLKASLQLPDEKNKKIVNEINDRILKDIRSSLMSLYKKEEEKKGKEIMSGAGIEVMPEEVTAPKKEENIEKPADMLLKIENPEIIAKEKRNEEIARSISAQKLTGSFQVPPAKTVYSISGISKEPKKENPTPAVEKTAASPKIDPYREPVE
jgi:hypothetical protein